MKKNHYVYPTLALAMLGASAVIYFRASDIIGPFIFLDEWLYFVLARWIHADWSLGGSSHFNPLYPFFISFFFYSRDAVQAYDLIRFFNAILFASTLVPIFYTAREFFGHVTSMMIAIITVLLPFGAISSIIWAEPLFYPLYACSFYFFLAMTREYRTIYGLLLGVSLGLLFLTKQAGIVVAIAVFLTLCCDFLTNDNRKVVLKHGLITFTACSILVFPWLIRNLLTENAGLLGYKTELDAWAATSLFHLDFIKAMLYQLSYLTLASFFLPFVMFVAAAANAKQESRPRVLFYLSVLLSTMGVVALAGIHRYNQTGYIQTPYGRYLAPLIPPILIIGIHSLLYFRALRRAVVVVVVVSLLLGFNLHVFTPLRSLTAYNFINSVDIGYLNDIFNEGNIQWEIESDFNVFSSLAIVFTALAFSWLALLRKFRPYCLVLLMSLALCAGWRSSVYVNTIGKSTTDINALARSLVTGDVNCDKVVYDERYPSSAAQHHAFWSSQSASPFEDYRTLHPIYALREYIFDFGPKDSPVARDAFGVTAPWVGSAAYSSSWGFGFKELSGLDTRTYYDKELSIHGLEDYVRGWTVSEFRIDLPPGDYLLEIHLHLLDYKEQVKYTVTINEEEPTEMPIGQNKVTKFRFNIDIDEDALFLKFTPVDKLFWAVSKMRVVPLEITEVRDYCYVSKRNLPLRPVSRFGETKIYLFDK